MIDYTQSYQYKDILRFLNQNRGLVVYKMGGGKTFIFSALINHLRHYGEIDRCIILTSTIGVLNIKDELVKLGNNNRDEILSIISLTYFKDRDIFNFEKYPYKTIILSYDSFRVINDYYDKLANNRTKKIEFKKSSMPLEDWFGYYKGIIILDESHQLGSYNSLRTKAVLMNAHHFYYRYMFTATPADKNYKFYSQLRLLDPMLVNCLNYKDWVSQFYQMGTKFSKYGIQEDSLNEHNWALLQDQLYMNYAIKRDKELNLPPELDMPIIYVNMSKKHRAIYEQFSNQVLKEIRDENNINNNGLVANLINNFQYACLSVDQPLCLLQTSHYDEFPNDLKKCLQVFNYEKDFNKLWALDGIIEDECNERGNRVIVFYYHPLTKDLLQKHLNCKYVLSADIDKEERIPLIESFKKSDEKVIIASISVANTSFSLNECSAAIYFENTWSYTDYFQSRGRIARIGKNKEVRYYQLCYNNSLNSLQIDNLKTKGQTIEKLIRKNYLTTEEWNKFFKDGIID